MLKFQKNACSVLGFAARSCDLNSAFIELWIHARATKSIAQLLPFVLIKSRYRLHFLKMIYFFSDISYDILDESGLIFMIKEHFRGSPCYKLANTKQDGGSNCLSVASVHA